MPKLGPPQFKDSSATWWKGGIKVCNLSPCTLFNHGRQSPLWGGLTSPESYESMSPYPGPPMLPTPGTQDYYSPYMLKTH